MSANAGVVIAAAVIVLALLQVVTFVVARKLGRYNVVDVIWGLGFVLVALVAAIFGHGALNRRLLLLVLVAVWGLRLSLHLLRRTAGHGEDPRYAAMMERHGNSPAAAALRIFLTQGVSQWFISLPIQISAIAGPTHGVTWVVLVVGVLIWLIGFGFEAIGDQQLAAFRADPNRGPVMDRGLWAWTRHPNYFGDACVWWGLWLIAASAWPGVLTVLSPLAMTYVLVQGTGAKLLEQTMSQRRGYPEYQQRTAYFFPRPPRR